MQFHRTFKRGSSAPQASQVILGSSSEKPKERHPRMNLTTITVDLERGNRIVVKWPDIPSLEGFAFNLAYSEDDINSIFGRIEDLQEAKKKHIPLNLQNAERLLSILRYYNNFKNPHDNSPCYKIELSTPFEEWFETEIQAKNVCETAHQFLKYDESTVQTNYPFLKKALKSWQGPAMLFLNAVTKNGRGAFLCDETGLGKTYVIGAHLASEKFRAVVICPAGLKRAWKRKIQDISNLSVTIIDSGYPLNAEKTDVIIVSYAMLKKRGIWPLSEIIESQRRVLILDEGQAAKNYDSVRTAIALKLSHYARHSIVVTATPLKNRVAELHPLLRITRRLWTEMSFEAFVNCHSTPEGETKVGEHLQKFMVRRRSNEVWKDAPKIEIGEAWLELTNREIYQRVESNFIQWLISQGADLRRIEAATRGRALVKMNKLRELAAFGKIESTAKIIEATMDHNEQVVIFCAFNEPLKILAQRFSSKTGKNYKGQSWRGSGTIIGATSEVKRNEMIDSFGEGKIGLLCIGCGAGGVGIDLPIARFGYFLDSPWSPADFEQCTGRLNRLGQERDCQFIKLLAQSTIDQRMEEIIKRKAETFGRAVGDADVMDRVMAKDSTMMRESVVQALIRSYLRDANIKFEENVDVEI